jgi:hypothetical protein
MNLPDAGELASCLRVSETAFVSPPLVLYCRAGCESSRPTGFQGTPPRDFGCVFAFPHGIRGSSRVTTTTAGVSLGPTSITGRPSRGHASPAGTQKSLGVSLPTRAGVIRGSHPRRARKLPRFGVRCGRNGVRTARSGTTCASNGSTNSCKPTARRGRARTSTARSRPSTACGWRTRPAKCSTSRRTSLSLWTGAVQEEPTPAEARGGVLRLGQDGGGIAAGPARGAREDPAVLRAGGRGVQPGADEEPAGGVSGARPGIGPGGAPARKPGGVTSTSKDRCSTAW